MRATITAKLAAGHPVCCWRCRRPIPNNPKAWHVGHSDDRTRLMGAECVRCNLKAAARKGARTVNAQRRRGVSRKRVVHPLNL